MAAPSLGLYGLLQNTHWLRLVLILQIHDTAALADQVDLGRQLKFPEHFATTTLRPDMVKTKLTRTTSERRQVNRGRLGSAEGMGGSKEGSMV